MTDPIRPRIDFDSLMNEPEAPRLRTARHFTHADSEGFVPHPAEVPEDDDGKPEALLTHALTPKRRLWRRMVVVAGIGLLALSGGAGRGRLAAAAVVQPGCVDSRRHHRAGGPRRGLRRMAQALSPARKGDAT
ncbi:MAG: hypothetical protein ACMX3H_16155 [Sodalis sp. (in: enterobacteria)]|uniref:hypothetical protein n=1 Tax=Sodalis sp. (in: enterobacteria) TaxID=1898979 RepID=UPI0039E633EF